MIKFDTIIKDMGGENIPFEREFVFESDKDGNIYDENDSVKMKIGDGVREYKNLPYIIGDSKDKYIKSDIKNIAYIVCDLFKLLHITLDILTIAFGFIYIYIYIYILMSCNPSKYIVISFIIFMFVLVGLHITFMIFSNHIADMICDIIHYKK